MIAPTLGKKFFLYLTSSYLRSSVSSSLVLLRGLSLCPQILISCSLNQLQAAFVSTSLNSSVKGAGTNRVFSPRLPQSLRGIWHREWLIPLQILACVRVTFSLFFPTSLATPKAPWLIQIPKPKFRSSPGSSHQKSLFSVYIHCHLWSWWLRNTISRLTVLSSQPPAQQEQLFP